MRRALVSNCKKAPTTPRLSTPRGVVASAKATHTKPHLQKKLTQSAQNAQNSRLYRVTISSNKPSSSASSPSLHSSSIRVQCTPTSIALSQRHFSYASQLQSVIDFVSHRRVGSGKKKAPSESDEEKPKNPKSDDDDNDSKAKKEKNEKKGAEDEKPKKSDEDENEDKDKDKDEDKDEKEKKDEEEDAAKKKKAAKKSDPLQTALDEIRRRERSPGVYLGFAALATLLLFVAVSLGDRFGQSAKELTWEELCEQYLKLGLVGRIVVDQDKNIAYAYLIDPEKGIVDPRPAIFLTIGSVPAFEDMLHQVQEDYGIPFQNKITPTYQPTSFPFGSLFTHALFVGLQAVILYSLIRFKGVGGILGREAASFKIKPTAAPKIPSKFENVAGLKEQKAEIMEFVSFLKKPAKYTALGARLPKGALLVGPPGTGKTLLAKATAGEAGVPFYSVSGSSFVEMYGGLGAARVRELFTKARASAPSIIWIDEIDAIGRARKKGNMEGGASERENTLNQLLVEMDGFNNEHESKAVVVFAGTNRAELLDEALTRSGRFDRKITIGNPDVVGRKEIAMVHLKNIKLADPIETIADRVATMTPSFSGADIAQLVNEAALRAARAERKKVLVEDFDTAFDRVVAGIERSQTILTSQERKVTAYHEAGHALAGWFLEHAHPVLKLSTVPRGSALGFTMYSPTDTEMMTSAELMDGMCSTLGGRVAEEILFGNLTTGASDDLDKVRKYAYEQIAVYGMSKNLPPVSYNYSGNKPPHSDHTAKLIDDEVHALVTEAYNRTKELLTEKKDLLIALGDAVHKREVLVKEDIEAILGPRPFADKQQWIKDALAKKSTE